MASSQGSQAQMCFDLAAPIDTSSIPIDFVSETLRRSAQIVESDGIRGTRSRTKERVRVGLETIAGNITMNPSPTELDNLLPVILGATEATDVFALAETLPTFLIAVDRVAKVFTYTGLVVNTASFSGSPGQPLVLSLDVIGLDETTGAAGSFPALTFDTDTMYVFTDAVFQYNSTTYAVTEFNVTINNLVESRFTGGSTIATDIAPTDREVTISVTTPYTSSETALYDLITTSVAGADGTLTLTNGNQSLLFTFANLKPSPEETPVVNGRGEILHQINFKALKSGSTNELIVTHDSTA